MLARTNPLTTTSRSVASPVGDDPDGGAHVVDEGNVPSKVAPGRVPGPTTAVVALITSAAIASHVVMPSLWRGRKLPVKQDHHGGRLSTPSGRRVL